jgi:hypothetical protein
MSATSKLAEVCSETTCKALSSRFWILTKKEAALRPIIRKAHGGTDRICLASGGERYSGGGDHSQDGDLGGDVLALEEETCADGCFRASAVEATRGHMPLAVQTAVDFVVRNSDVAMVYGDAVFTNERGEVTRIHHAHQFDIKQRRGVSGTTNSNPLLQS